MGKKQSWERNLENCKEKLTNNRCRIMYFLLLDYHYIIVLFFIFNLYTPHLHHTSYFECKRFVLCVYDEFTVKNIY